LVGQVYSLPEGKGNGGEERRGRLEGEAGERKKQGILETGKGDLGDTISRVEEIDRERCRRETLGRKK